jgi:type II secretory pathway component PulF
MSGRNRVPKRELLMLTSQLAIMAETGVDLAEGISQIADQCSHKQLRETLLALHQNISEGMPIAAALEKHPQVFDAGYVANVAAGEASGKMAEVLDRLTQSLRNEIRTSSMLKTVMAYPVILALLSFVVLGVLLFFVLPHFGEIFEEMKVPLPASTEILLNLSRSLREDLIYWVGGAAGLIFGGIQLSRSRKFRTKLDKAMLNTAILQDVTRALNIGRSFQLLGSMLQSGVPLLPALQLARGSIKNSLFRELFNALEVEVLNGRGIGMALAATPFVPGGASRMVLTAEKTGRLGMVMQKVGSFYEDDGERRLQELSKYLEPIIIIFMGCMVAMVVLSIMLPMLSLSQAG